LFLQPSMNIKAIMSIIKNSLFEPKPPKIPPHGLPQGLQGLQQGSQDLLQDLLQDFLHDLLLLLLLLLERRADSAASAGLTAVGWISDGLKHPKL
jgi:hypothetical protein